MLAIIRSRIKVLSSCLLSKNVKIRICKTVNLPIFLYWRETWSLTLREEHRLSVFQNRVLKRMFGTKRDEMVKFGENCKTRTFVTCAHGQVWLERSCQRG
jgi:hypothetical protein